MEATRGYIGTMERKLETTRGYIGIMETKMEIIMIL